jgi:chemotaxis signal transduction protein
VSAPNATAVATRLVLFEIGGDAYGLPIADVLEVTERAATAGIPAIPRAVAGAMNLHGDALPVVAREALFGAEAAHQVPAHVLVLAGPRGVAGGLGLPVDRVIGLADVTLGPAEGSDPVAERVPFGERLLAVLDARRLYERAARAIEEAARPTA